MSSIRSAAFLIFTIAMHLGAQTAPAGSTPFAYLRAAAPIAVTDTMDTYESPRSGGEIRRGNGSWWIHEVRQVDGRRWESLDTWHDSSGTVTARQLTRTGPGSITSELESVRAPVDSATLLVYEKHATGWVVPANQLPRLYDGMLAEDRYALAFVIAAIVRSKPVDGQLFTAPAYTLYGANALQMRIDSFTVIRRDTLSRGATAIPVTVLARSNGGIVWAEDATGSTVAARGNAGPQRHWWHVRRGVSLAGLQ